MPKTIARHRYYMSIANAVAVGANCLGRSVGAVIVKGDRIISTGYNGTPAGMTNCLDGGCVRCANSGKKFPPGTGYDVCFCVHAEENALLAAARFGMSVDGAEIYSSLQPCFVCSRGLLQAGIQTVFYQDKWDYPIPPDRPWLGAAYAELTTECRMLQIAPDHYRASTSSLSETSTTQRNGRAARTKSNHGSTKRGKSRAGKAT